MKFITVLITSLLIATDGAFYNRHAHIARIINGLGDIHNKYPFVVPIVRAPYYIRTCTGSVITPDFVLTASHCVEKVIKTNTVDSLVIVYGNLTSSNISVVKVLKALTHPSYKKAEHQNTLVISLKNDIAVLLVQRILMRRLARVSTVDYMSLFGRAVTYVGAGGTFSHSDWKLFPKKVLIINGEDQVRLVQIGEALVIPCRASALQFHPMMCMRPKCIKNNQGVQGGDSGGPVLFKNKIVGVCTGVENNGDENLEALYTPVSPYLDWIVSVIRALQPDYG